MGQFGKETLQILDHQPERLREVSGLGDKRIAAIAQSWQQQKAVQDVMLFLSDLGISAAYATKIYKQYGDRSIAKLRANPYQLVDDVRGIGFAMADQIARHLGISLESEFRYDSGILHSLSTAKLEGHCLLPQSELIDRAVAILSTPDYCASSGQAEQRLQQLETRSALRSQVTRKDVTVFYLPTVYAAENNLAAALLSLASVPLSDRREQLLLGLSELLKTYCQANPKIQFSTEQIEAIFTALSQRVCVITGGPGVGKTTVARAIVWMWEQMGYEVALAAPTGKAAQRLAESTGKEARTIHRLLEFGSEPYGFKRDAGNPLEEDAVLIDESSMLDIFLANSLVQAVPETGCLLLIGDVDQLPSVGAGAVLQNIITSKKIPVARLTQIFRQAANSRIITNAHRINRGTPPILDSTDSGSLSDCLFVAADTPEFGVEAICKLITDYLPAQGKFKHEIQCLCPMIKGALGVKNLNVVLQNLLNPATIAEDEIKHGAQTFRVGDRVIHTRNNYRLCVFNGETGTIVAIDREQQTVTVNLSNRSVDYGFADLEELALAYSISIHRSQGSEFPVVILPMHTTHYILLTRNLIYTGLTRAKELAIFVGTQQAIELAVRQKKDRQRYTLLTRRLSGTV